MLRQIALWNTKPNARGYSEDCPTRTDIHRRYQAGVENSFERVHKRLNQMIQLSILLPERFNLLNRVQDRRVMLVSELAADVRK
jgi:hypothetical protein